MVWRGVGGAADASKWWLWQRAQGRMLMCKGGREREVNTRRARAVGPAAAMGSAEPSVVAVLLGRMYPRKHAC